MCTRARSPLRCILPPHMVKKLAEASSARVRARALDTLRLSERLRGARQARADFPRGIARGALHRTIYDAKHTERLPGKLVREEGGSRSRDRQVEQAYDGLGATFRFYEEVLARNSIDDKGQGLDASVHYGRGYNNAFWDGRQMVFGDGDGEMFGPFTPHLDVIAHELTHGVIAQEAAFEYENQPGALNESFADVFGSLALQYKLKQTARAASWRIGQGILLKYQRQPIRSLAAPGTAYDNPLLGKDPQPAHMKDYRPQDYPDDSGGVHVFSGIPNHAFYLVATKLGGRAWEKAGRIWYLALTNLLSRRAQFADAALGTATAAGRLFGATAERAVRDAWEAVGVSTAASRKRARARRRAA